MRTDAGAVTDATLAFERQRNPLRRLGDWGGLAAAAAVAAAIPFLLGPYQLRVATLIFMCLALAQAWNLIGGYAGLLALAHAAFFGVGAVVMSIMLINRVPLWAAAPVAMLLAVALAALISIPTLRMRGHYFVVGTLLIAEGARNLMLNLDAFGFHGGVAVNIIRHVGLGDLSAEAYNLLFYFIMLLLAGSAIAFTIALERSRWGMALVAFRDNRAAAEALGVPAIKLLVVIFMISAAFTALAGSAWAAWIGVVDPNEAFGLKLAFQVLVMVYLGGKSTVWGPTLGVVIVLLLEEVLGVDFPEFTLVVSGLIVVAVVLFLPDGLIRLFRDGPAAMSWSALKANFERYRVR